MPILQKKTVVLEVVKTWNLGAKTGPGLSFFLGGNLRIFFFFKSENLDCFGLSDVPGTAASSREATQRRASMSLCTEGQGKEHFMIQPIQSPEWGKWSPGSQKAPPRHGHAASKDPNLFSHWCAGPGSCLLRLAQESSWLNFQEVCELLSSSY